MESSEPEPPSGSGLTMVTRSRIPMVPPGLEPASPAFCAAYGVPASPHRRGRTGGGFGGCDPADGTPAASFVAGTEDRIVLPGGARYGIVRNPPRAGGSIRHNAGPGTPRNAPSPLTQGLLSCVPVAVPGADPDCCRCAAGTVPSRSGAREQKKRRGDWCRPGVVGVGEGESPYWMAMKVGSAVLLSTTEP